MRCIISSPQACLSADVENLTLCIISSFPDTCSYLPRFFFLLWPTSLWVAKRFFCWGIPLTQRKRLHVVSMVRVFELPSVQLGYNSSTSMYASGSRDSKWIPLLGFQFLHVFLINHNRAVNFIDIPASHLSSSCSRFSLDSWRIRFMCLEFGNYNIRGPGLPNPQKNPFLRYKYQA